MQGHPPSTTPAPDAPMPGVVPYPPEFAAYYRAQGYWQDRPMREMFAAWCAAGGSRIAVLDSHRAISFAELDAMAANLALNLLDLGISPGERLVVQLPNTIQFAVLHVALQKIGAIPVMALPAHRFREVSFFASIADTVAIVTPDRQRNFDFCDMTRRIAAQTPSLRHRIVLGEPPADGHSLDALITRPATRKLRDLDDITINPETPALFLLSGGTTGIPKLIPRTHNDYVYNSLLAASVCAVDHNSVLLNVLPIGHNLPLACPGLQGFLARGARVVLHSSTAAAEVFPLIERFGVTHIHVVPALLIAWLENPAMAEHDLGSVRVIQSGGQRLQPEVRRRTEAAFINCRVQENFGMAEGLLMFVRLDDPLDVRRETVGRPICPDDEVTLLDEDDQPVASGSVGELCCRGPYTLRGYYNAPEHNARAFTKDGFYRSGDLMRQHESGNYIVEGRRKDLINRGAEKISAEEIEELILHHPAVENVACVAMPDPVMGERTCACLVLRRGHDLNLAELVGFLERFELAKYKLPERIERFEHFPLSNFGKVSKRDLVAIVAERCAVA